jgi:Mg-chelatase subunit ChlD
MHLVQAGEGLTAALRPEDRAALITFSHLVDLRVPMTGETSAIRDALAAMAGTGATALRDAVQLAVELQTHDRTRPLILLFTDGRDTASWLTEDAVLDSARRVGVVIHACVWNRMGSSIASRRPPVAGRGPPRRIGSCASCSRGRSTKCARAIC